MRKTNAKACRYIIYYGSRFTSVSNFKFGSVPSVDCFFLNLYSYLLEDHQERSP